MPAVTAPIQFFAPTAPRPRHSGGDAGPLSHAVRISFGDAGDAARAAKRFEVAARSCWPTGAAGKPRLWLEEVAAPSTGPTAIRRRRTELTRTIGPAVQPPMRSVMLHYRDGRADMIITCHRSFMSEAALRHLAALFAGFRSSDCLLPVQLAVASEQGQTPGSLTLPWAVPHWACGIPEARDRFATSRFRLGGAATQGDLATWLTALAVVLRRYDDEPSTAAALGPAGIDETPALAASSVLVLAWADREPTLEDLTGRIRTELRGPGGSGLYATPPGRSAPAVGLVFTAWDDFRGGQASVEYHPYQVPIFPLTISVTLEGGRASLRCDYRPQEFAPAMVRQFTRHLAEVHRQVIEAPQRGMPEVELLDADERTRIAALGRTASPQHVQGARIHDVIAARARAHPGSPALSDGKQRMRYAELDVRADLLARGLRALGVHDGEHVGTCLERSAELVTALLGVLKAGAAYVPMDPGYPDERLTYTVCDAGIRVVIGMPGEFPADGGVQVVTPDDLANLGADGQSGPPVSAAVATDPAYVIYTSGSTGRPKGVVVPHANVVALIDGTRDEYQLGQADVWTLFHSSAFDFSVWEIWGCLLTGGHLIVVPFWVSRTPDEFRALLAGEKVTVLSQTPSAFGQLLKADRAEPATLAVRLIVFGGEPLDARMLLPWFDRYPEYDCRVVNMFGITETTVHVTAETLTRRHALERSRSVGRPLPGWHVYVMDSEQRMVPPGIAGEICVGGAGVSLGYLNLPELTSQRFVPDPCTGQPMYRSGDKGRMCPDGRLEHLGRLDGQVKVRGFRIELDEIRSVLLESPGVTAAAAVVNDADTDDPASARIDAYVVLADGVGSAADVRRRAMCILPDYMLPATITPLQVLPLTTNGKLDVSKLPAPELAEDAPPIDASRSAVRDFSHDLLAAWTGTFGKVVKLDDNFFELGGNSLYAVQLAAAMRERGWPQIPIREIYRNPTVRRLAACMGHPISQDAAPESDGRSAVLSPKLRLARRRFPLDVLFCLVNCCCPGYERDSNEVEGSPLDTDDLPRIFDRFYRTPPPRNTRPGPARPRLSLSRLPPVPARLICRTTPGLACLAEAYPCGYMEGVFL
jgi:amino acid adenylation domain-containing protein